MKFYSLLIISMLYSFSLYSQDTLHVVNFEESECNMTNLGMINERIISYHISKDTIKVKIGVIDNCAFQDSALAILYGDTLELRVETKSNVVMDCECYFEFNFEIIASLDTNLTIRYKNLPIVLSDKKYGIVKYKINGNDSLIVKDELGNYYQYFYYETGELKRISIKRDGYWENIEYFKSGSIKSLRQIFGDFNLQIIREWDENGKLLNYENPFNFLELRPTESQKERGALRIMTIENN